MKASWNRKLRCFNTQAGRKGWRGSSNWASPGRVAQWTEHLSTEQEVAGSTPAVVRKQEIEHFGHVHGTYGRALATWCSGVAHVSVLMHWNNAGCLRRGVYFDQEDTSYLPAWLILPKIFGKHCIEMGGPRDLKHRPERPQTRCQMTAACMTSIKHSVAAVGLPPSAHTKHSNMGSWAE